MAATLAGIGTVVRWGPTPSPARIAGRSTWNAPSPGATPSRWRPRAACSLSTRGPRRNRHRERRGTLPISSALNILDAFTAVDPRTRVEPRSPHGLGYSCVLGPSQRGGRDCQVKVERYNGTEAERDGSPPLEHPPTPTRPQRREQLRTVRSRAGARLFPRSFPTGEVQQWSRVKAHWVTLGHCAPRGENSLGNGPRCSEEPLRLLPE